MKINKAWMASIAVYFFAEIVKRYNVNLPTGWEETAYTIALYSIQYGAFALAALWNKYIHHKPVPTAPEQPVVEFKTYTDMVPIMQEVNSQINIMLEQISSGKHTQATQESINAYLKIHDLIKKKGA